MPCGNRTGSGTRLPLLSRDGSAQQSSMLTYRYPASFRPVETNVSATPSTNASLNAEVHPVAFQLLKPIGGVRARPFSSAAAGCGRTARTTSPASASTATAERNLRTGLLLYPIRMRSRFGPPLAVVAVSLMVLLPALSGTGTLASSQLSQVA